MKSTFFVIADRGHLKAFRAEKSAAGRPPHLELVESHDLAAGFAKQSQKLEDNAGRFPVGAGPAGGKGGGNGRHQNSVSEKHYELEDTRRLTKELAERIGSLLRQEKFPSWSFAAPSVIKNAVVEELGQDERSKLAETVSADLVHLSAADLATHFPSLGAA